MCNWERRRSFPAGSLYNAGHYVVVLVGVSLHRKRFVRCCARKRSRPIVSFLAKPSRLPVGLHDGITGAVYVFDAYHNLIAAPTPVSFELSNPTGAAQKRIVETHDGAAWTEMDSTRPTRHRQVRSASWRSLQHARRQAGSGRSVRIEDERPASRVSRFSCRPNRCAIAAAMPFRTERSLLSPRPTMARNPRWTCRLSGELRKWKCPPISGATISVASGVVLGNEIRWEK